MIELWLGIAALTVIAIAFVFLPFVRARKTFGEETAEDRKQQNIEIFRERLDELEAEKQAGNLAETDFLTLKTELERNLLSDVEEGEADSGRLRLNKQSLIAVTLLAMMIPASAIGLYANYGRSADLELSLQQPQDPFNGKRPTLEEAVAQLEKELKSNPQNPEGWFLLSTTYMNMGRFAEAAKGFEKILALLPQEAPQYASVMGQYAQALFFANGNQITEPVREQIDKTLAIEPFEITVLGLLGIEAFEKQDYEAALGFWLKALRNAEGEAAKSLRSGVMRARQQLIAQGKPVPDMPELALPGIRLNIQLSDELLAKVTPEQTVFIFAREVGQRVPLAAVRITVADLLSEILLDDSNAMNPAMLLSSVQQVEVTARISQTGTPEAQPGDMFGSLSPVNTAGHEKPLTLLIDKVVE